MTFDECTPFPIQPMRRSARCSSPGGQAVEAEFDRLDAGHGSKLFGIVQGSVYDDLRSEP
jgi:tRNA-guanine family transglycosylase